MTASFWQRIDRIGRNLAPFAVTVILVLIGMIPLHIPGYAQIAPELALMSVFYWTVHRPDLLRPSAVFLIGVLQDILSGGVLGLGALILVTVHWVLLNQRRFFLANTFPLMWFGFALIVYGAAVMQWAAYSVLSAAVMPMAGALYQATLTLALFPVFAWLFIKIHRAFLQG